MVEAPEKMRRASDPKSEMSREELARAIAAMPARIEDVTASSREARQGFAFLAYPGATRDGRDFIADAVSRGVSAVLYEAENFAWNSEWKVPQLAVKNLKAHASAIAGIVHGDPSQRLWMVGVTGTNGKTSVSQWVAEALTRTGKRAAVLGTIGNGLFGALSPSDNTTPDAVVLQRLLHGYADIGASACAMEVSSHGLDQGRVADIAFDVAVFTNLTRDHLDYHGSMEAYGEAKAKLFDMPGVQTSVINVDDAFGRALAARLLAAGKKVIRFAVNGGAAHADLIGSDLAVSSAGLTFRIRGVFGEAHFESSILGTFNGSNLLAVIGTLLASGIPLAEAAAIAGKLRPVAGRMQTVRENNKPLVVVDYAHTPDALEKALATVSAIVPDKGRLLAVFGCGGDRDRGKRPQMGAIATKFADRVIVTSDNPRTEDPYRIIADIEAGILGGKRGATHLAIEDRHQAIYEALNEAQAGDIVVIAGKGHEDYQIIGETKHHFSDVEVAQEALAAWKGRA